KSTEYISPPSAHQLQVSDCGILLRDGQIIRPFLWAFCLRDSHPGGFRFGDYWRLGLLVEVLVVVVSLPLLLIVWPL
ncbi:hypothetical protein, partial [Roseinatronobacter ekhonensis]|uniref:hypothetical protein n=1 Tax=Roseinatronobacter ekhonensis TaxID=254356 RepID=UPI0011C39668